MIWHLSFIILDQSLTVYFMYRFFIATLLFSSCHSDVFHIKNQDIVFRNGKIITANDGFAIEEMMVVRGDTIAYIGEEFDIEEEANITVIDLNEKSALPGFVEPHTHPAASAVLYQWLDISGFTYSTAEEALAAIQEAAESTPKGQWIFAFGWDAMLLQGALPPYRKVLDEISVDHPIWVMMQSMHSHYFNSHALELAGVNNDIENPAGGGYYEKDANGRLTGLITESATLAPFIPLLPQLSTPVLRQVLQAQYQMYNNQGITSIGVTGLIDGLMPQAESLIQELAQEEAPSLRLFLYRSGGVDYSSRPAFIENDFFKFMGYKYWADGSPYTGTMLVRDPYEDNKLTNERLSIPKASFGHTMLPPSLLVDLVTQNASQGVQISIHAQGDSACHYTLDIFAAALDKHPVEDHRHRLEHLALVTQDQVERMNRLGLTPSFHINHIHYYGDFLARIVGKERANSFMPLSYAVDHNMKFSLHNDSPMYPPLPLLALETAVTRKTANGRVLGESHRISKEEGIKALTIYPAWQMHAEDRIGSLEIGKQADIVILDQDIISVDPDSISEIGIYQVFINGKKL